jgi:spermidine synthase
MQRDKNVAIERRQQEAPERGGGNKDTRPEIITEDGRKYLTKKDKMNEW